MHWLYFYFGVEDPVWRIRLLISLRVIIEAVLCFLGDTVSGGATIWDVSAVWSKQIVETL